MKSLLIIRHAKSNQHFLGNDFERPLNDRGFKDAQEMAKRLKVKIPIIDTFISSPAIRAKTTAEFFAKEYNMLNDDIVFISSLYHAPANIFYEVIKQLPNELNTVALFAHNPGITYFINELIKTVQIDNMPTCGVFAITINSESWTNFATIKKEFLFFDYPKFA